MKVVRLNATSNGDEMQQRVFSDWVYKRKLSQIHVFFIKPHLMQSDKVVENKNLDKDRHDKNTTKMINEYTY